MKVKSYEELQVWQEAMCLAGKAYVLQKKLPKVEVYGLGDQIRRAAVSVPSNIAEGFGRETTTDFVHFLCIARGSLFELRTQIELASRLGYLAEDRPVGDATDSVARLLNALIRSLRSRTR